MIFICRISGCRCMRCRGMVNAVTFTPTQTTEEIEAGTRREYTVEELGGLSEGRSIGGGGYACGVGE